LGSPSSDVNWFSGSKNGGATIDAFMDAFVRRQKWGWTRSRSSAIGSGIVDDELMIGVAA